jgi:uncharacterized protein (TIGR04255 family)
MQSRNLPNKPLVEAILEMRWQLAPAPGQGFAQHGPPGLTLDPNYKLALGRFAAYVEDEFPHYEQLPSASIPDEMASNVVQHRFRVGPDSWPLAQLGPGILTFNDTDGYDWPVFRDKAKSVVAALGRSYPQNGKPMFNRAVLKYIDAAPFDYFKHSVFDFFGKLKINSGLAVDFLTPLGVEPSPNSMLWRASFRSSNPAAVLSIQISTALKGTERAVVWETTISSADNEVPTTDEAFATWLEAAHTTTSDVFLKMTEGELYHGFF